MKWLLKNSLVSLVYQILLVVFTLITRTIFLKYLGVEVLGISSTFTSIVGALSLTELGVQTTVVYKLYAPIANKDYDMINKIMAILKKIYVFVGIAIIALGICMIPFLQIFLKGIQIDSYIVLIFCMQILCSSATYFFSYKRILFYADQKEYITKSVDMIFKIACAVFQIIIIVGFRNYVLFLVAEIIKNILSNIIISRKYNQLYIRGSNQNFDKDLFVNLMGDAKKVFAARLSNYIYTSTDNLIISSLINTIIVGYVANYVSVISQLKSLITAVLNPIVPYVGNNLVKNSKEKSRNEFMIYTHIRYFIASIILVPTTLLLDLFVQIWIGKQYILDDKCLYLLIVDFYIGIIYAPCYEYNNANGLFKEERNIMLIAAFMNIILSFLFCYIVGLPGVYMGTVITQLFLWGKRGYIVFTKCLNCNSKERVNYWIKMVYNASVVVAEIYIAGKACSMICIENDLLKFIVCGIACECIVLISYLITQWHTREALLIKQFIAKQYFKKVKKL